jgi:hypothetical protein
MERGQDPVPLIAERKSGLLAHPPPARSWEEGGASSRPVAGSHEAVQPRNYRHGNTEPEWRIAVKTIISLACAGLALLCTQILADTVICPAVNDVYIDQGKPDENQGHRTRILVSWHNSSLAARGLMQFDIPQEIEASRIASATLHVSRNSTGGSGVDIDVDVFALNAPFDESTDTWDTLAGGDFDPAVYSSGTLPAWSCPPPCTASLDLTVLLQGNLDKARHNGILMMAQNEGAGSNRHQNFATKEDTPPSTPAYIEIVLDGETGNVPSVCRTVLESVVPNPFNPSASVSFSLGSTQVVDLKIYDPAGRLVRTLLRASMAAGRHLIAWDGTDDDGRSAASGVYLVRLATEGGTWQTIKATLSQ